MSLLDTLTKSLVDVYSTKLSQQEQADLMEALEFVINEEKYKKFYQLFPDIGPFRKELYKKHLEFFAAGARYRERGFIAGNRCITPWTFIQTDCGERPSLEVMRETSANVLSWDGAKECIAQASHGILKGIERAYRLVMDTGEFLDCTPQHRVLTESGWQSIDQIVSLSSGLHLRETLVDYQASCVEDGYLCDQPLLYDSNSDLGSVLRQDGVHTHAQLVYELGDVMEHILQYIHPSQVPYQLSTQGDLDRFGDLFYLFQAAKIGKSSLSLSDHILEAHSLLFELASDFQSYLEQYREKCVSGAYHDLLHSYILSEPCNSERLLAIGLAFGRSYQILNLERGDLKSLHGESGIAKFYPLYHPPLIGGKRIVCIVPLGFQPIIDLSVDGTKNFKTAGIFSHNTGKSEAGAFETVCHATGLYPDWWEGKRFTKPTLIWVGGDTATTCRDIIQDKLLGPITEQGSGMLPKDSIIETKSRRNVPDAIETIRVKHITGGTSTIVIKTYEQGRASWQGTAVDFIWIDEECPQEVYGEALIRTMTTGGSTILTFTPLSGLTELVSNFLDNSQDSDCKFPKYVCTVSWDDVPHITPEAKEEMLASTPPALRAARSKGEPTVGSGRIYPVDIETIITEDFKIPKHWQKAYAFDVGWHNSAVAFGAFDRDNDILYIYSEHKQGEVEPVIHAQAIKARGEWLKGVIDPAARGRSQIDGQNLYELYKKLGLKIYPAQNAVEAGIYEVWSRLTSGRLKIFGSCTALLKELVLYHRDEKGKIVKKNDHILDCLRYLCMSINTLGIWQYPQDPFRNKQVVDIKSYMTACM